MRKLILAAALTYSAGEYQFNYPPDLIILQDHVYREAGGAHVVVLRHKDAESGDLRTVEIGNLRSLSQPYRCVDYTACRLKDGVVIGTNSEDPEFQRAFEDISGSFRRRSKS